MKINRIFTPVKNAYNKGKTAAATTVNKVRKTIEPKIYEAVSHVQDITATPKREILARKMKNTKRSYLIRGVQYQLMKNMVQNDPAKMFVVQTYGRKVDKLKLKPENAAQDYKKFVEKEKAIQQSFDRLNNQESKNGY